MRSGAAAQTLLPTRKAALQRIDAFIGSAGRNYARTRNFDFGPDNRRNVSQLSPYIRHRLVQESELLATVLQRHSSADAGKFVEEVFWRTYFKGWLEHRPSVWSSYRNAVDRYAALLERDADMRNRFEAATAGNTGIDCFDAWSRELQQTGYLHNHARMWFASIWVFTLRLPWQLGADFFYRYLLDGDPASNTLGWRWVCGLHTSNKTYLARVSNIVSYTDGRFNPSKQLAVSAAPLEETEQHDLRPLRVPKKTQAGGRCGLLITEEDCLPETLDLPGRPSALIAATAPNTRSPLPAGPLPKDFTLGAVSDALARAERYFGIRGELASSDSWERQLVDWANRERLNTIVTAYAPVGPIEEQLSRVREQLSGLGIELAEVRRDYDGLVWPHATKGYFKLKRRIPGFLRRLDISSFPSATMID